MKNDEINNDLIENKELSNIIRDYKYIYAMTTFDRAIPYYKDGLILVYRRIIYDMLLNGHVYSSTTRKSAKIVGDVIGTYHPHGDSSVYNAMVSLSESWTNNCPLIHGQGNWGTVYGDPPAAYRYTEAKLTKFLCDAVLDISKNSINYKPNFDNYEVEPEYIPFKIPIILINGAYGIAESYVSSIPTHNLSDVVKICIKYIKNKNISNPELVDGFFPDFPTGAIITNKSEIEKVYKYGKTKDDKISIRVKSNIDIDRINNRIIIKDLPYGVTRKTITDIIRKKNAEKHVIMSKILELVDIKKTINGKEITEYEVLFERNSNILEIARDLEKFCCTKSIPLNFMLNYGDHVNVVNIKDIIESWYETLKTTWLRKLNYQSSQSQIKVHIYKGLLTLYDYMDEVINFIKKSSSKEEIIKYLVKNYDVSEVQGKVISEMQLYTLSKVSKDNLIEKIKALNEEINDLEDKMFKIDDIIIEDLKELDRKYGTPRNTTVIDEIENKKSVTSIVISNGALLYSHNQYSIFDLQNIINGKNILNGLKSYKIGGKNIKEIKGCNIINKDLIGVLLFTNNKTARRIEPSEIIETNNWIPIEQEIKFMIPICEEDDKLLIISSNKKIKIISASEIGKMTVNVGDILSVTKLNKETSHIIIVLSNGCYHYLNINDIPTLSRNSGGVNINIPFENTSFSIEQVSMEQSENETLLFTINDTEGYNYIIKTEKFDLLETNRVNKPKTLPIILDDGYSVVSINKFDSKLKDSKCILIGKYSTTQMSIQSLKSNDLYDIPKRIPVETIGLVQYVN